MPAHWEPYTLENGNYLEINKQTSKDSRGQYLRPSFLKFWTTTYQQLPTVIGNDPGLVLVPPTDDPEAGFTPPADLLVDAQAPVAIGF